MDNKQLARQLRLSIDGQTFVVGRAAEQVEAIYERAFASARRKDAAELTRLRAEVERLRAVEDLASDAVEAGAIDECYLSLLRDALAKPATGGGGR